MIKLIPKMNLVEKLEILAIDLIPMSFLVFLIGILIN